MLLKLPPTTRKVLTGLQIVLTKTQGTENRIVAKKNKAVVELK
jgi:hypothetical protein